MTTYRHPFRIAQHLATGVRLRQPTTSAYTQGRSLLCTGESVPPMRLCLASCWCYHLLRTVMHNRGLPSRISPSRIFSQRAAASLLTRHAIRRPYTTTSSVTVVSSQPPNAGGPTSSRAKSEEPTLHSPPPKSSPAISRITSSGVTPHKEDDVRGDNDFIEVILSFIPCAPDAIRVATVYQNSTASSPGHGRPLRSFIRTQYKTLKNLLLHLQSNNDREFWGVYLSFDLMHVTRATSEHEAGEALRRLYTTNKTVVPVWKSGSRERGSCKDLGSDAGPSFFSVDEVPASEFCFLTEPAALMECRTDKDDFTIRRRRRVELSANLLARPLTESESLSEVLLPHFGYKFVPPPPPAVPLSRLATTASKDCVTRRSPHVGANFFTGQMLVSLLPTYFIPMNLLVDALPEGYTAEHVDRIFGATATMEAVTLRGRQFVRLHGGKKQVNFLLNDEGATAHHRYSNPYQPDPYLSEAFRPLFDRPYRWLSLYDVIEQAPPHIRAAFGPYQAYESLLFFAQMQHKFGFTPEGLGSVCWAAPVTQLGIETSPTPMALAEVSGLLEKVGKRMFVADMEKMCVSQLSDCTKRQLLMYYGGLLPFLACHGSVFTLEIPQVAVQAKSRAIQNEDSPLASKPCGFGTPSLSVDDLRLHTNEVVVDLVTWAARREKRDSSLERRLEDALTVNDRRTARKLRRRMALESDPDSPYGDPQVLLDAILRYLPQRRPISVRYFLRALPSTLTDFLPDKPLNFFRMAPDKVQLFEYRYRNNMYLLRVGVPLPEGKLRDIYTEQELLYMIAAEVDGHPRVALDIMSRLPYGAKETIRKTYKQILELIKLYPEHFIVVYRNAVRMDTRNATVTLVKQPPPPSTLKDEEWDRTSAPPSPEAAVKAEEQDREAFLENMQKNTSTSS